MRTANYTEKKCRSGYREHLIYVPSIVLDLALHAAVSAKCKHGNHVANAVANADELEARALSVFVISLTLPCLTVVPQHEKKESGKESIVTKGNTAEHRASPVCMISMKGAQRLRVV